MPMPVAFRETEIDGILEVVATLHPDHRGFFSECYNREVWLEAKFRETFVQDNLSLSRRGVLRGMHYQIEPYGMGKLVRTLSGSVYDVAVDLRRGSPTFGKWLGRELTAENGLALWIPSGFAHGFIALEDNSLVYYKCTETHHPEAERALAYNDPEVGIVWPIAPEIVSPKDAAAPGLCDAEFNFAYQPAGKRRVRKDA
ncbi:MAG TPA: dTDP-4-dehydrorhamnose 3,5-epimerase [Candidatus Hydrogenedentes bacterium]|nr:dTDP-4-dehydrorhamnose 3,5-epimerase [Candidatus Hydrogenedentota bacterium]HNT86940.1 dTDP-4-dehydrorhamnose 3,5-epimerase [Candidatus Hydrogenedentota bacterium]